MFCQKCGNANDDNALFCKKCGQSLNVQGKKQDVISKKSSKGIKKSKWLYIGLPIVIIIVLIMLLYDSGPDYVETLKCATPYTQLDYTYQEVFEKYFDNLVWGEDEELQDPTFKLVCVEGELKTGGDKLFIAFTLQEAEFDSSKVKIQPNIGSLNDVYLDEYQLDQFIQDMFIAYDSGNDDIDDIVDELYR